jgi:hypothetical protein
MIYHLGATVNFSAFFGKCFSLFYYYYCILITYVFIILILHFYKKENGMEANQSGGKSKSTKSITLPVQADASIVLYKNMEEESEGGRLLIKLSVLVSSLKRILREP